MRNNAERLLRDVGLAHGAMTARLDQGAPGASKAPGERTGRLRPTGADGPGDELDVPEFMPRD